MKDQGPGHSLDQSQDETELSGLMKQAQAGDADSYQRLLIRIRQMMTRYLENTFARFRMPEAGAEDVLQEILLAIHSKRHTYDPHQYFLPWMYAIGRYKVVDHFRRHRWIYKATVPLEDELENIEALMSFEPSADFDVETLLQSLPEKQRQILKLVKLEGLSIEEAAKRTGFSTSDIKVTVHRAIKALREQVLWKGPR